MKFIVVLLALLTFFTAALITNSYSDGKVVQLLSGDPLPSYVSLPSDSEIVSVEEIDDEPEESLDKDPIIVDDEDLDLDVQDKVVFNESNTTSTAVKNNEIILPTRADPEFLFRLGPGVNLAGAEFAPNDPTYQHIYPTASLPYYADKGIRLVRLPFLWERIQPELGSPLNTNEVQKMTLFLDQAQSMGMYVILDLHNYARYRGSTIGTDGVDSAALADLWTRISTQFKDHPAVIAYGLMNEPHDLTVPWKPIAQESVDAIRAVDPERLITVCGDGWSGAFSWQNINNDFILNDPADGVIYEAHVYFDPWNVGVYTCTYEDCGVTDTLVSDRIDPFIDWLAENGKYGYIGEFGVPANDTRWLNIMDEFLDKLDDAKIASTIWAGGPNWGNYVLSVEPNLSNGVVVTEKPQMELLQNRQRGCLKVKNADSTYQCVTKIKPIE